LPCKVKYLTVCLLLKGKSLSGKVKLIELAWPKTPLRVVREKSSSQTQPATITTTIKKATRNANVDRVPPTQKDFTIFLTKRRNRPGESMMDKD